MNLSLLENLLALILEDHVFVEQHALFLGCDLALADVVELAAIDQRPQEVGLRDHGIAADADVQLSLGDFVRGAAIDG